MNIAFYTQGTPFNGNTLNEKGLGGSESALTYIARSLASLGNEVTVFNNCDRPGIYSDVSYKIVSDLGTYPGNNPFDVCVFSRFYEPVAQINAKVKVLWLHDVAQTPYYGNAFPVLNKYIDKYFFISDWQKKGFINLHSIPRDKIYLTRNGVDLELFQESIPRNRNKLIYINTPNRGLDALLGIFPAIRQSFPDAELHLYTGMSLYGDSFSELEERLKPLYLYAQQLPGVHMHAPVPKHKLARELMSSYLSLYPSHFEECCSIASLETQAAGTPMITSCLGGLQDTILDGETGILIPVNNLDTLSHAPEYQKRFVSETINLLTNPQQWERLSHGAMRHSINSYSWDSISKEWDNLFRALVLSKQNNHT